MNLKPGVVHYEHGPIDDVAQAALDKAAPECDGVLVIVFDGNALRLGDASLRVRRSINSDRVIQTLRHVMTAYENEVAARLAGASKDKG